MDAGIQEKVVHLDDEAADEGGIDMFLELDGGMCLLGEHGHNLLFQRFAVRMLCSALYSLKNSSQMLSNAGSRLFFSNTSRNW